MPNTYTTTARILELLPQVCTKNNIEQIQIKSEYVIKNNGEICHNAEFINGGIEKDLITRIYEPQIRQILVGLQEVLGRNILFDRNLSSSSYDLLEYEAVCDLSEHPYAFDLKKALVEPPHFQAEALCSRWLDGLTPLFDSEPEKVLQELVELLENLLK